MAHVFKKKKSVKDLGVTMSNSGKFVEYINNICIDARKLSGLALGTFSSRSKSVMLTLWKVLILPKLDYCSQLWNPSQAGLIQQLELVQVFFGTHK